MAAEKKTPTRIYLVGDEIDARFHLVRATSQSQARNHVAKARYGVKVASQDDIVKRLPECGGVEDASKDVTE